MGRRLTRGQTAGLFAALAMLAAGLVVVDEFAHLYGLLPCRCGVPHGWFAERR